MGLFQSLFGGAGSDKADKMRQAAIDAFTSIQTPALAELQIQLEQYVQTGRLTPEQAEAELLKSNAFNDIITDPALEGAQKQALMSLQEIGTKGGLTAIDRSRMADITAEQGQVARSRNEAIMSQARERGMGGSDISTINQLMSEQAAADRASRRGTEVAANAEARALQALMAGGQMATGMRAQDYGEQAQRAGAQNALDLFNAQTLNQTNLYNVDAANKAQAANLANEQAIANANVGVANTQEQYNAQQNQQLFQNEMQKAGGIAGTYNQWAGDATAAKRSEQAADLALTGGIVQAGGSALSGAFSGPGKTSPAGGGMGEFGGSTPPVGEYTRDAYTGGYSFSHGGEVLPEKELEKHRLEMAGYNRPPLVRDFKNGGIVPGEAIVPGNNPGNDTVPANLSPGEVVVPRTAMSDDEEFDMFMEKFRPSRQRRSTNTNRPLAAQALSNIQSPLNRIEGR